MFLKFEVWCAWVRVAQLPGGEAEGSLLDISSQCELVNISLEGAGAGMDRKWRCLALIWDAGAAGCGLTCCTTALAPRPTPKQWNRATEACMEDSGVWAVRT